MVRLDMMKKERELNMIEMKLSEMDEWMIGLDVDESGVYGIKLDDDCNVIVRNLPVNEQTIRLDNLYGGIFGYHQYIF